MNNWNNWKQTAKRIISNFSIGSTIKSPISQIMAINTLVFMLWRVDSAPKQMLVQNFSYHRKNIKDSRYYTMFTYAFSHLGPLNFLFNMIVFGSFGRSIRLNFGNRTIWWLYLLGAVSGAISMQLGMPNVPNVVPQVGADAALSAMLTFYGLFNLRHTAYFFFIPVPMWGLLVGLGIYSLLEPSKKNIGGMFAGLLAFQLWKMRII